MNARQMRVDDINVGRRTRNQLYGPEGTKLRQSIEQTGLRRPLAVAPDGQLIDGWRRLILIKQMGWREVTVFTVSSLQEAVEALVAARAYSVYPSLPMTMSESARLGLTLEKLPRARGRGEDHRILVSTGVDMSTGTWQRIRTIARPSVLPGYSAEERELSEKLLQQIDEGSTTAAGALRALKQLQEDTGRSPAQSTALTGVAAQRRAITQANTALSGLLYGLKQIQDFDLPDEELATYMNEMTQHRSELGSFVRRMRKAVEGS